MNGFAAETLVHTEKGLVPIEQIKVGENVLSKAADGSGELVYKSVKQTIITNNVPVFIIRFRPHVDPSLPMHERINLRRALKKQLTQLPLVVTANHPFWTMNKGWVEAQDISSNDSLITKDNKQFVADEGGGYDGKYQAISPLYNANKHGYAYDINFGDDTGENLGSYVNLSSGKIDYYDTDPEWVSKIWSNFDDWKQNLVDQTPEEYRDHAEFFGFRQGEWRDPDTVEWGEGEGPLTMTVYNLEVEDTHTYFVGEAGIWVHNCGGEEDCVGYRCVWRTRKTRVNKTKKEKEL